MAWQIFGCGRLGNFLGVKIRLGKSLDMKVRLIKSLDVKGLTILWM